MTNLSAAFFFGEGKHGQAPAEHFLFCVSFHNVNPELFESVKAYSFNENDYLSLDGFFHRSLRF